MIDEESDVLKSYDSPSKSFHIQTELAAQLRIFKKQSLRDHVSPVTLILYVRFINTGSTPDPSQAHDGAALEFVKSKCEVEPHILLMRA